MPLGGIGIVKRKSKSPKRCKPLWVRALRFLYVVKTDGCLSENSIGNRGDYPWLIGLQGAAMPNLIAFLLSLVRKPNPTCGTMLLWGLPPEKAREVVAALDALSSLSRCPVTDTPRLSIGTLVRLSTHEGGVKLKLPLVGRERKRMMARLLVRQINSNKNPTR